MVLLLSPRLLSAQEKGEPYASDWKRADSLMNKGLPESAAKIARSVYDRAKAKGQQVQMIKAQLYLMNSDFQRSETAHVDAIRQAEENISATSFPEQAIWQNIAAQLYWTYYQQHRYEILQRTRVNAGVSIGDFRQWDAARFFERISGLYQASIRRAEDLEQIPIANYDPILVKGQHTRNLRPSLFDFLAFRALEFYTNNERDVIRPAFHFVMNDPRAFAPAAEFISVRFESADTASLQWQALKLYQRILGRHLDDAVKDPLIDADLSRLSFAYNQSMLPNKTELYKTALERIERDHSNNPVAAMASLRIAQLMLGTERTRMDYDQPLGEMEKKAIPYAAIRQRLEAIIKRHPGSEGAAAAEQLLYQILSQDLNLTAEEVVLPDEPFRILINYRNVPRSYMRLIRLDNSDMKWGPGYHGYTDEDNRELLGKPHFREWQTELPASGDYERHSTEVKIDALPTGTYAALISSKPSFDRDDNILSYVVFQVSRLSAVQGTGQGFVLDRKTGRPIGDVAVDFLSSRYNPGSRNYSMQRTGSTSSSADGKFIYRKGKEADNAIRLRSGKDSVLLPGFFTNEVSTPDLQATTHTFFFTDRSIYRPGQTIHFKGIMVSRKNGGKNTEVIPNRSTEVIFYDVNGEKITSASYVTNEFGSFSGSFVAPEGRLTGNMRIANNSGNANFSVEEYKRPKFSVSFDTLKEAYSLNETITLKGKAAAFAGNNLGGATVAYRVVRNTRYPYWWMASRWGFPRSPQMEIAQGTVTTDNDGNFIVAFKAIPDESVSPESLPVFTYTISADVTDINGETRSGSTMVSAGYTSLQLSINIPDRATPQELDSISILSMNLNDRHVPSELQLRISRLRAPDRMLRKRVWSVPDQFIIDSVSFKKDFPNDAYKDEDNHMKWPLEHTVLERSFRSAPEGLVTIPANTWNRNGWYLLEVSATDKNGKKITERRYVQVWSPAQEGIIREPLLVVPASQSREPGSEAVVHAVSGYDELNLMRQVLTMDHKAVVTQVNYSGRPAVWSRNITGADRGGVLVHYITVKENRVYNQQAFINVPWTNKELNISWETHRDRLQPGAQETWTMVVRGNKKEKIAAEMVAALYDASLDVFRPHQWQLFSLLPQISMHTSWQGLGFGQQPGSQLSYTRRPEYRSIHRTYDRLRLAVDHGGGEHVAFDMMRRVATGNMKLQTADVAVAEAAPAPSMSASVARERAEEGSAVSADDRRQPGSPASDIIQPRSNLQETAFFFPALKTDADGNVRIQFTIPEALTQWKLLGFAHTKDFSYGVTEGTVRTQKDLMVTPNLPRFLRQGDKIIVSTRISNMTDRPLSGTATLELVDPATGQSLHLPFRLDSKDQSFTVPGSGSTTASWTLQVPGSLYEPVTVRVLARAGNFTDGEENLLPVVTNRMLVTETLPIWLNGAGTRDFSFDKLKQSTTGGTLAHHALTVEFTGNPAWIAVQSLPSLAASPHENAEAVFNRYYATALAAHIVTQSPKLRTIFDRWRAEGLTSSFRSPLEGNEELKSALLLETPWVLDAKTEKEQRERIGRLFDAHKLSGELDGAMRRLRELQHADGSFPWFKGMMPDRYITQYIITGLGRLQQLGISDSRGAMEAVISKAMPYLDEQMRRSYDQLVKSKANLEDQVPGHHEVQYLYMRSFFDKPVATRDRAALQYYRNQLTKHWPKLNAYLKGMAALALHRQKQGAGAEVINSLRETAIRNEELGTYWIQRGAGYWWYDSPVEAQALIIEAFSEIAPSAGVDDMKRWLLRNKQTNSWETTKATADAVYALLLRGADWLEYTPDVTIRLGDKTVSSRDQKAEAGTGYFKQRIPGGEVTNNMGNVALTVANTGTNNAARPAWGAVYWQYFEDLDKITAAKTPLAVSKQLFIERNTARGPELQAITGSNPLKVGDKVTVRLEIEVDRDMEYVHLKDMRPAAFEPANVISGYSWQGMLGYYQSTRDISTSFYFDRLPKGKYVFEYPVFVSQSGEFSGGIATIQCHYAPEFSSHTEGSRVVVR